MISGHRDRHRLDFLFSLNRLNVAISRARALADPYADDRVIHITSRSKPGVTYEVRISAGVVTCTCPGFSYRGNCTHARDVAAGGGG